MLPPRHRLRRAEDFASTRRRGARVGGDALVLYFDADASVKPLRVGFAVPKTVGSAVVRNRVRRRLREVVREQIAGGVEHGRLVVQVRPPAADASWQELSDALSDLLVRAAQRYDSRKARAGRS